MPDLAPPPPSRARRRAVLGLAAALPLALALGACTGPAPDRGTALGVHTSALARATYPARLAALERDRERLAARLERARAGAPRAAVLAEARGRLEAAFREVVMPAWTGTAWDFYGTTRTPGEGAIACGHFVATALTDLGFAVPRLRLGQAASEHIARTFVPRERLLRFSDRAAADVVAAIRAAGPGVYALGLDHHAGFLDVEPGGAVLMCHAGPGKGVLCEDAATAPAFASRYRVAARLFADDMVAGWLAGRRWDVFAARAR